MSNLKHRYTAFRYPEDLWAKAKEKAARQRRSFGGYILTLLDKDLAERPLEQQNGER